MEGVVMLARTGTDDTGQGNTGMTVQPSFNKAAIKQSLSEGQKANLNRGMNFIQAFRKVRHTMPISHAFAFLTVALDEGLGVNEYAERLNVSQTVMTRWLFDIGQQNRSREPGYELVTQRSDPLDLRKHQTFLTDKGRALAHELIRVISK
jgi:DNA-binding MarR family transcriptional regulator